MRALLLVPVAAAEAAADLCALAGVVADVAPVAGLGCLAVLHDPAAGPDAATRLSRLARGADVLLLEATADQVSASRWAGGSRGEAPAAGLLLATWPDAASRLALGTLAARDAPGATTSAGRSRWRAVRSLTRARRR